jgi:hypothetical protein
MPWYAASAVVLFRFKEGEQDVFPVWENVYLVHAQSIDEAEQKASELARQTEGDDGGSLTCNGRLARKEFCGIRKVVTISNINAPKDEPTDGAEITFSEMEVNSAADLKALAAGECVTVKYID